jgi:alkylated DNA repair protein (DNA oxidative demethylase)
MTAAGQFGWFSDRQGYRYLPEHPDGHPWPPIPALALKVWDAVASTPRAPECCLLNFYSGGSAMGMHQDRDEVDMTAPVVSISLGDEALFRIGGTRKGGKTDSIRLRSGDVLVMGGTARLAHHGISRVYENTSTLLAQGGRLNLTLRVVT